MSDRLIGICTILKVPAVLYLGYVAFMIACALLQVIWLWGEAVASWQGDIGWLLAKKAEDGHLMLQIFADDPLFIFAVVPGMGCAVIGALYFMSGRS